VFEKMLEERKKQKEDKKRRFMAISLIYKFSSLLNKYEFLNKRSAN